MAEKRRLPVLNASPKSGDDDDETRPPWHWVGFGTVLIFAAWLPLAYVGGAVQARMLATKFGEGASQDQIDLAIAAMSAGERAQLMLTQAIPVVLALALAAFAGGMVVTRFGGASGAGVKEAARSGAITSVIAVALTAVQGFSTSVLVSAVVITAVATGFAAWGGRVGRRKRA